MPKPRKRQPRGPRPAKRPRSRDYVRSILVDSQDVADGRPAVEALQMIVEHADDPGGDLARVGAYDLDPGISRAAFTLLYVAFREPAVPAYARTRVRDAALPVLLEALRDPALPDERKLSLGALFMAGGGELSPEEHRSFFRDFEGAQRRNLEEMMSWVSDQPAPVEQVLAALGLLAEEAPDANAFGPFLYLSTELAERDPPASAALLGAAVAVVMEHGVAEGIGRDALRLLAGTRCARATWTLGELSRWPAMGDLGAAAGELAERLSASGVPPRAPILADFSHGVLTAVDGAGSRSLHLYFRTPEGGLDAIGLMVNDAVGVKGHWYVPGEGAKVEATVRERMGGYPCAPCGLRLAREILADAWAIHVEREAAFPARLFIMRPYFGEPPIVPRRRAPNLGAYMLELVPRSPDLFRGSDRLLDLPTYAELRFASDAAYDHVDKVRPTRGPQRLSKKKLETFLREIAIQERDTLLARMAVNLEVESLAGRATQRLNRVGARTWLGLSEEVLPFHEVPFIRALGELSAEMIIENLRMGFHSQAEVNQAALEMDDEFGDLLDEFEDDLDDELDDGDFFLGEA